MPKKKQPRNAFFLFMVEYKARCERNGEKFPNGLRDIQDQAGLEWQNMTVEQKRPFELQAKAEKEKVKGDSSRKETNMHNTFGFLDRKKMEEDLAKEQMNLYLEKKFASLSSKHALAEHKWYIIHVNYFCISEGEVFHPAEVAVSEFSLHSGVSNVYHTIVEGAIPLGYRYEATQRSETYHHIPLENRGERDFYKIRKDLMNFLEEAKNANRGVYPPLFTMEDNISMNHSMSAVKSLLQSLCEFGDDYGWESIVVYPLDRLFMKIQTTASHLTMHEESHHTSTIAITELQKDVFKWSTDIACKFHLEDDNVEYCSKSYVQRWAFVICDYCCDYLEIERIRGRHVAMNSDVNFIRRVREKKEEEEEQKKVTKKFTLVDHSKLPKQSTSGWQPHEQAPLPRPERAANPILMSNMQPRPPIDQSEDNFPSISVGNRGRGRGSYRGMGRGASAPPSFAEAMKNRK